MIMYDDEENDSDDDDNNINTYIYMNYKIKVSHLDMIEHVEKKLERRISS